MRAMEAPEKAIATACSRRLGQPPGTVRQARAARIRRQMGPDPGVRRRGPLVQDIRRHAGEDELIGLAARSAAQALLVPFDPDVPPFVARERRFQTLPIPPGGDAFEPERQVRQLARAEPRQRGGVEANFQPKCRFTLIDGTARVRHFNALPETRIFSWHSNWDWR